MGSKNLNEKIMECISNPAKSRLMIEIMRRGKVTAKYLAEKCVDIPQTTLYRYLKRMTDDGLLKIVGETPIRGTVEKTYALTFDRLIHRRFSDKILGLCICRCSFNIF